MKTGCQVYLTGSVEAVEFYQRAFDVTLGMNFKNDDGTFSHASLMSGDNEILAIAENKNNPRKPSMENGNGMSFNCYGLGTREAVLRAFDVLSEGALNNENPNGPGPLPWCDYCFYLTDKFGIHWWVAI